MSEKVFIRSHIYWEFPFVHEHLEVVSRLICYARVKLLPADVPTSAKLHQLPKTTQ